MAITISGENNNDKILAQDGVIDQISGINIVGLITSSHINVGSNIQLGNAGIITATTFNGNLTGNVNSTSPLLLQTGGSERFRITGNNELGIAGANYGSSGQVLTSGGSGSAVSWTTIPTQVNISNNSNNRVITGGGGTNLVGESNLTFDGTTLFASGNITAANDGNRATQGNVALVVRHSTNAAMRANHFIHDDFPSGSGTYYIQVTESGVTNDRNLALQGYGGKVKIGSGGVEPVETLDVSGNVKATSINLANSIFHTGDTDTLMSFSTDTIKFDTAGSERLRIDSSGTISYRTGGGKGFEFNSSGSSASVAANVFAPASYTLAFGTNGNERLRIMSNGNVGIGTINAGSPLHIESNNAGLSIRRTGQYLDFDGNFGGGGDQAIIGSGGIRFYNGYSNMRAIIDSNGNMGIGDNQPPNFTGYKSLSIHGSTGGALVFGDDGTDEWETYGGDGVFKIYDRAATTTRLHLDGSYGRFGINTSSFSDTSTALSLKNGVAGNDHTILDIICNDNQTCRLTFSEDSNSSKGSIRYYYTGDGNYMSFYTNGGASTDERLRINSNGSFNIGGTYTGTTHKLQVDNGTTHFKGRVFIRGTMSFNSTPFGANVTYDTGISVNAGGYGGSILAICSKNYGSGTNTQSGVYLIKFHYDGNNTPTITLLGGSNLATFGQSGSNTLTVFMGASNNMFTAIESSVVPTT